MVNYLLYFFIYSFLGFLLEVAYTRIVRAEKKDRKCFFLLPLCPVYGVGALCILLLPAMVKSSPPLLMALGAAAATAAEFFTGLFYERVMRVKFWDYSGLPGNLGGRVCLLFSGFWGALALILVYLVHPLVSAAAGRIPGVLLPPALLLLVMDGVFTVRLLRREGDTEALRWYRNHGVALHGRKPLEGS